jgi:hypothetical protein
MSALNEKSCPMNYSQIENEKECELAAADSVVSIAFAGRVNDDRYPRGCYWASYGDNTLQSVWYNIGVGSANPISRMVCAKEMQSRCDPGTYKTSTRNQCADCNIGTFQPGYDQPSCQRCPKGFYGVKPGAKSEVDGCKSCPPGTYQDSNTRAGSCSVCAPGTVSDGSGMDHCHDCSGQGAFSTCPGGTTSQYTDVQLAVAQNLSRSSTSPLERQCQKHPATFVRKPGKSDVDGAVNPNGLPSAAVLGSVGVLMSVAVIILSLHSFLPEWVWSNVDFTSLFHKVPPGRSPIKQNTSLGSAFTLAFVLLATAIGIVMYAMNEKTEVNALVILSESAPMTLAISVGLPLWAPVGNDTAYCKGIAYINDSLVGMTCDNAGRGFFLDSECTIGLSGCRFVDPAAQLTLSVPWSERFLTWSVAVDSTDEAKDHKLSGVVTSGDASSLISPKGVVVAMLAQPAFLKDTTNADLTRHGSLLSHLPCKPPVAVKTSDRWDLRGPDLAWNLTLELRASPTQYLTVRSMKQGPLELCTFIFTTIVSVMGVWKLCFSHVEGLLAAFRSMRNRRRRLGDKEVPVGLELQPSRGEILARVTSNSRPDESASYAAVKEERNARLAAEEELHRLIAQQAQQLAQLRAQLLPQ